MRASLRTARKACISLAALQLEFNSPNSQAAHHRARPQLLLALAVPAVAAEAAVTDGAEGLLAKLREGAGLVQPPGACGALASCAGPAGKQRAVHKREYCSGDLVLDQGTVVLAPCR